MTSLARCLRGLTSKSINMYTKQPTKLLRQEVVVGVRYMSEDSSRLHSTDIAFKPAESGWGGSNKYSQNFDSIFNNKNKNFSNDGTENKKSNEEEKTIRESTKTE